MKKQLVLTALLAAATALPAHAQSQSALEQIRADLSELSERVGKVEAENQQLKQENAELKEKNEQLEATTDYLRSNTSASRKQTAEHAAKLEKADALVKNADWASKVAIKGDMRYRHEQIDDAALNNAGVQATDHRYRDRVRARVNIEAKPADNILVGIGFATTEGGDPRSSNQTLTGVFSRKAVDLDLAYFDWKIGGGSADLIGGKMKQPFFKTSQSAFWDNDVNPEGMALTFNRGIWFGSAYNFWLNEVSAAESAITADASMAGAQIGVKLPVGASTLTFAAHYYDLSAVQGRAPFYNANANGNTTTGAAPGVLVNDYEVANLTAEFNTMLGSWPLLLWADAAQNQDPSNLDTAWGTGVLFGKASNPKTWEFGATYQVIEKDALFAQLIDSDFGGGTSDSEGWTLRVGFAPVKNWTLNGTVFLNKRNIDVANSVGATEVDYDRLQLDLNFKF